MLLLVSLELGVKSLLQKVGPFFEGNCYILVQIFIFKKN